MFEIQSPKSEDMTSSGDNYLNIRTNAIPKWDRTNLYLDFIGFHSIRFASSCLEASPFNKNGLAYVFLFCGQIRRAVNICWAKIYHELTPYLKN